MGFIRKKQCFTSASAKNTNKRFCVKLGYLNRKTGVYKSLTNKLMLNVEYYRRYRHMKIKRSEVRNVKPQLHSTYI